MQGGCLWHFGLLGHVRQARAHRHDDDDDDDDDDMVGVILATKGLQVDVLLPIETHRRHICLDPSAPRWAAALCSSGLGPIPVRRGRFLGSGRGRQTPQATWCSKSQLSNNHIPSTTQLARASSKPMRCPPARMLMAAAALVALVGTASAIPGSQIPNAPARTHTFKSYLTDTMKPLIPVYSATVYVLEGTYAQDEIWSLDNSQEIGCGQTPGQISETTNCTVVGVYKSRREADDFELIGNVGFYNKQRFAIKYQNNNLRLVLSMAALNAEYSDLDSSLVGRRLLSGGSATNGTRSKGKGLLSLSQEYYYDPLGSDGVTPYFPGLTPADILREQRQEAKARRRDQRLARMERKDLLRYENWVRKQLGYRKGQPYTLTPEQFDKYFVNPTNKRFPYKWRNDLSGKLLAGGTVGTQSTSGWGSKARANGGSDDASIFNFDSPSFEFTYAIVIQKPNGTFARLDMTIIPRVHRRNQGSPDVYQAIPSAFLCRPDGIDNPSGLTADVKEYIPTTGPCPTLPSRPNLAYAISSANNYTALHPEENDWLQQRLDKTAQKVQAFVNGTLQGTPWSLSLAESRLKIAISNSGGGKRALLHSLGVAQALYSMGIFDQASWNAGISGGSWYVSAHTLASRSRTDRIEEPQLVFNDIAGRVKSSVFGDYFEPNEILTDASLASVGTFAPFFPSRIGTENSTYKILCESELKLQSSAAFRGRSASPLDYWGRAITTQILPTSDQPKRGLDITFSSLAGSGLLQNHAGPLPMFQIQENRATNGDNGLNKDNFRLWEVSPFDITLLDGNGQPNGNVAASFPTKLLGSSMADTTRCVTNLDNIGYLQGISSWAIGAFPPDFRDNFCGKNLGKSMCQATGLRNPFKGFAGLQGTSASELFSNDNIFVTDGGTKANSPVWSFLTPAREADIIFSIDAGGASGQASGSTVSTDTEEPTTSFGTTYCKLDTDKDNSCFNFGYWSPVTKCCDDCTYNAIFTGSTGCFSVNDPTQSNLGTSLAEYRTRTVDNKAPAFPTTDQMMGQRVVFLGCDTVSTATPIINIPNRIVLTGHSGHNTFKGATNINIGDEQEYRDVEVQGIFDNGAASLPNKAGKRDFKTCLACLYYARAKRLDSFMQTTQDAKCQGCYSYYCVS